MAKKETTKKKPTLAEWVGQYPSQADAALKVGVPKETLNRWLNHGMTPNGLSLKRLEQLGIDVSEFNA